MTPAEVIANVLFHVEGEGMNDEHCLSFAGDILLALSMAGLVVVSAEDLRTILDLEPDGSQDFRDAAARLRAVLPERTTDD